MCPASTNLNCELKHSPIFISCFSKGKYMTLFYLPIDDFKYMLYNETQSDVGNRL